MGVDSLQAPEENRRPMGRYLQAPTMEVRAMVVEVEVEMEKQTDSGSVLKVETTDLLPGWG